MVAVKLAKKVPACAAVSGALVASDRLADSGVDKRSLGRLGFKGDVGQTVLLPGADGAIQVLVGVGKRADLDSTTLRKAGAAFARAVSDQRSAVLVLGEVAGELDAAEVTQAVTEGVLLGGYRFDAHKSKPDAGLGTVTVVGTGDRAEADGARRGNAIAASVNWARDLVNEPGGTLTATVFADRIAERAGALGIEVEVLDKKAIAAAEMGGLLAVNQGSDEEPRFVKLTWSTDGAEDSNGLVGKGITFDSGGLSIKPADGMMTMKCDMGGAAAVVAATCAIAELGVPISVTAYTPLTDNMTGGSAQRPGDIFTARNGKTVEVLNTDAEGRLVLADALSLASDADHDAIIDLATLTGACMVALGARIAGVMGSDALIDEVRGAADDAGERV